MMPIETSLGVRLHPDAVLRDKNADDMRKWEIEDTKGERSTVFSGYYMFTFFNKA